MPISTLRSVLHDAFDRRYGVPAFNVVDDLTMQAVVNAAVRARSPVIVQTSVKTVRAAGGGVLAALFVSGAYPELADWPNSGQSIFAVMLGGINSFLGPVLGAMILLALNDFVTHFTEYHGLVLGIVILAFALGLRRGVLDFLKLAWPGHPR